MPRASLFDPANALVTWAEAREASELTGLKVTELATFRAERHALHQVLIRVTVEIHIPDGPNYADLGISLRSMAASILETEVAPELPAITRDFEALRKAASEIITRELETRVFAEPPRPEPPGWKARLFGKAPPLQPQSTRDERALEANAVWTNEAEAQADPLTAACFHALARFVGAVLGRRGALVIPKDVIVSIATNLVSNDRGGDLIGERVAPLFDRAVEKLGHYRLPSVAEPVVLNGKGASASGKSSIRAQQRRIAQSLGLDWRDFAVISPDYWRKILIDYNSLGDDYKYAAMLTGQELEIIDRRLDLLMADKAAKAGVPHMLIDRFRFDSFLTPQSRAKESKLLTRFGSRIFLFFLVTPPAETVTRAWTRGLETGRYKAVDDLLFHNIEAYAGMPDFFLSWAQNESRWVHYEFLDNSVPQGDLPKTIAYGRNGKLVIRDIDRFLDVERFKHINLDAGRAEEILSETLEIDAAMALVRRMGEALPEVEILVPGDNAVAARVRGGTWEVNPRRLPSHIPAEAFGAHEIATDDLGTGDPELLTHLIGE